MNHAYAAYLFSGVRINNQHNDYPGFIERGHRTYDLSNTNRDKLDKDSLVFDVTADYTHTYVRYFSFKSTL